jgi:uncharacterized repeat protein (TIGR01451 family)/fimbrial isopeptide formation D2 family protein
MVTTNRRFLRGCVVVLIAATLVPVAPANPYPPVWDIGTVREASGPIHFAPAPWPTEPADPKDCGTSCGQWRPYTRFQADINDPRVQDPSNGGTAPQNYVNVASSCIDKALPSIYYSLHKDPTNPTKDVIMFRWRVEQVANNYATGPSAGNYGATDPWSSALWTVLFDIDGDGYRDLAAHLDGSSGSPGAAIDRIAGIWGNIPTQSVDYLNDPNIHLIAHNPTAFVSGTSASPGSTILNFHDSLSPDTNWSDVTIANRRSWDYGTTRAKLISTNSCNEYFVDYQIPVRMLDASSTGPNTSLNGPKITRDTPISMLFCTANSLNNPFQKDCALNRGYLGNSGQPGPFGDYLSFNKTQPYSQPIVSSVTATAPNSCSSPNYILSAKVQDTLYVDNNGVVKPSIGSVKFFYWYDSDGDGTANEAGSQWIQAATGTLRTGTINTWDASWNASGLARGRYLIGVQAVDDATLHDDGVSNSPVNNRTFSYFAGSTASSTAAEQAMQAKIYTNGWTFDAGTKSWLHPGPVGWVGVAPIPGTDQQLAFAQQPHAVAMTPGATEDWYGNPDATGTQIALTGVDMAINACGVAPTITKTASASSVTAGGTLDFTVTIGNSTGSAITLTHIDDVLPAGFSYHSTVGVTNAGSPVPAIGQVAAQTVTWQLNGGAGITVANNTSVVLIFTVTVPVITGTYSNTATAATNKYGTLTSSPVQIGVGSPILTVGKTASVYQANTGDSITYTITYANNSPVNVTGVTLSDALPAGLSYVAGSCTGACSYTSGTRTLNWSLGDLASGQGPYSISFQATVDSPYTGAQTNTNTATIASAQTAPASASASVLVIAPTPQLTIAKTASVSLVDPALASPNNQVTFTIAYANTGSAAASSVAISDALPTGFTYVSATGSPSSAPSVGANGTVTWTIGSLAAGASDSVTVTATATSSAAATTTNTATISASNAASASDSATVGVKQSGSICTDYYFLSAASAVNVGTAGTIAAHSSSGNSFPAVSVGGTTAYLARNALSGTSTGVSTTLTKNSWVTVGTFYLDPASLGAIDFSGSTLTTYVNYTKTAGTALDLYGEIYDYNPSTGATALLANTPTVATDGGNATPPLTISLTGQSATLAGGHRLLWVVYANETNKNGPTFSTLTNDAGSYAHLCTTPPANVTLEKSVDQSSIATSGSGRTLTYTLRYANTSSSTAATGITIEDTLPAQGVTYSTCSTAGSVFNQCSSSGGTVTFSNSGGGATVSAGGSGSVTVTVHVDNDLTGVSSIANSATVKVNGTSGAGASATTVVTGAPSVQIAKQASKTLLIPGDTLTYTLTAVNQGSATATNVSVSDALPGSPLSFVANTCSPACSVVGSTLTWNLGSLAPGQAVQASFQMTIGTPASGITTVDNTATATYGGGGTGTATSNTVTVSVSTNPNLSLSKSVSPSGTRAPGDVLTYTITVGNTGSTGASGVVVTDPIPANTRYKGGITADQGSGSFDAMNNQVVFDVGTLLAGASKNLSFQVTVNSPLSSGATAIANTASVAASNASSRTAGANSSVTASPTMTLSKTGPSSLPLPGTVLTAAASGASVVFVNSTASFTVGQYVQIGGTITQVTAMTGSSLTLAAPVTAGLGSSVLASATYLLAYRNTGNADAANVVVSDPLPSGWLYVASSPAASTAPTVGVNGTVTWNLGTVAAGSDGTLQLVALPTAPGRSTNTAALTDNDYCKNPAPPASCSSSAITDIGGLIVTKATSTPTVAAGGTANWAITVANTLSTPVTGVTVTDILPSGFSYAATGAITSSDPTTNRTSTVNPTPGDAQPVWGNWTLPAYASLTIPFSASVWANVGPATYQNSVSLTTTSVAGIIPFDPLATTAEDVTVLADGAGMVQGVVYRDVSGNGSYDPAGDIPLPGVAITIIDSTRTAYVVYTDAAGRFSRVVAAGSTIVDVDDATLPTGLVLTTGTDGADPTTVTVPNVGSASRNTGYVPVSGTVGAVRGNVWNDGDLNQSKGPGEANMLGVQVQLRNGSNAIIATAYTDVYGNYSFPNVPVGSYNVHVVRPSGYSLTTANDPANVNVTNGGSTTASFGLAVISSHSISGQVFNDADGSGLKSVGESGTSAGGLYVVLVDTNGNQVDSSAVAADGRWSINSIVDGSYTVRLVTSSGTPNTSAPSAGLPAGWFNTGESLDGTSSDGMADGILTVVVSGTSISTITQGIRLQADVIVQKNGPAVVATAGIVGYTVRIYNAGPGSADGTVLADPVPVNASNVTWSCGNEVGGATCPHPSGSGAINETLATLPAGGSLTYTVTAVAPVSGSFINSATATVLAAIVDPNLGNNTGSVTTTVGNPGTSADLSVTKYGPTSVAANGTANYVIVVANAGPAAADGARVTDMVPANAITMNWTCGNAVGGAVCPSLFGSNSIDQPIASFPAGSSLTYAVSLTAPAAGSIVNNASVAAPSGVTDPDTSNNSSSASTGIGAQSISTDLAIAKTGPAIISAGGTVNYHIVASNRGPHTATAARVLDAVPIALTSVSWICGSGTGGGTCTTAGGNGNGIDTMVDLPAGASVTLTVSGTAPNVNSAEFINTARILPPTGTDDPDPTNNLSGPVITGLGAVPDIYTTVTAPASATIGDTVSVTIAYGNVGSVNATGVAYQLQLPAGLSGVSCSGSGISCTYNTSNGTVTVIGLPTTLMPGQQVTLTLQYSAPGTSGTTVATNSTITTTSAGETPTANNTDQGSTITASVPTYAVSGQVFEDTDGSGLKSASEAGGSAGGLYAVLVNGSGNVVASSAVAADGTWSLGGILNGSYTVRLTTSDGTPGVAAPIAGLPVGWTNTGESVNGANTDGNADGNLALTINGASLTGITLGIRQQNLASGQITGAVFVDINGNGSQDGGETGANAISVSLYSGNTLMATTTTGAGGAYVFTALPAGSYTVKATLPSGYLATTSNPTNSVTILAGGAAAANPIGIMQIAANPGQTTTPPNTPTSGTLTILVTAPTGSSFIKVSNPSHGSVTVGANGSYTYTPNNGFFGTDTFRYQVCAGNPAVCAENTVTILIDPSGIVYDSQTRQPISGATVTLMWNGNPIDTSWVTGGSATQVTGAAGYYGFFFTGNAANAGIYSLNIAAAGYRSPSVALPPIYGNWPAGGGSIGTVGAPAIGQNVTYYLSGPLPTANLTNNNIPLDPLPTSPNGIPTLSPWSLTVLSLLIGLTAMATIARLRPAGSRRR